MNTRTRLRFCDPLFFLLGIESSIRRVLRCPHSLFLALALVATAAMAREYDAVSWWHQPQDLLGPFAASLAFGAILFLFVSACLGSTGRGCPSFLRDYRLFMTGYWMTAPLAWFYAIPIETMADEITALRFNLTMLSIVSIWRVLLFSRVVAIQFGLPMLVVLPWILTPCMAIAFIALLSRMLSMVSLMGGIRLTQTQQILVDYQSGVSAICFYGILPMFLLACVSIAIVRGNQDRAAEVRPFRVAMKRRVWLWPGIAGIVLLAGAWQFQPRIYQATQVDRLLQNERIVEAIEWMQSQGEAAFPRVWDPPPKFPERDSQQPAVPQLVSAIEQTDCQRWIADRLLVQADEIALRQLGWYQGTRDQDYLQRHFPQRQSTQANQAIETLTRLQEIRAGDEETLRLREELLRTLNKVLQQALANEAEESQTDSEPELDDGKGS